MQLKKPTSECEVEKSKEICAVIQTVVMNNTSKNIVNNANGSDE